MTPEIKRIRHLVEAKRKPLKGGRWVTVKGTHIYVKGKKEGTKGAIVAGPPALKKYRPKKEGILKRIAKAIKRAVGLKAEGIIRS